MALAVLFVSFSMMLNEIGLGAALVQRETLDDKVTRQVFGLILLVNFVLFCLLVLLAPYIAGFFNEDRLTDVIRILSLQFLIMSFELVPMALLERELNLKSKSIVQVIGHLAGGVTSLSLALLGYGVWALVWGNIANGLCRTVGMNIVRPYFKWPSFSLQGMRSMVLFGGYVTGERLAWFFYNQADIFIVGKLFGKNLLGIYSVAMHLSSLIMQKTGEIIYTVSFPAFSLIQAEPRKISEYLLKAVRLMSTLVFPMFIGMASVSEELVFVLLGETWKAAAPILQILCFVMPLRMLSNLLPPVLQGIGRPDVSLRNLMYAIVIMPIAFLIGSNWGLTGVGIAWVIAFPIVLLIMLSKALPLVGLKIKDFVGAMVLPAIFSAVMYAVIYAMKSMLLSEFDPAVRLIMLVMVGAIVYILLLLSFHRAAWDEMLDLVKRR